MGIGLGRHSEMYGSRRSFYAECLAVIKNTGTDDSLSVQSPLSKSLPLPITPHISRHLSLQEGSEFSLEHVKWQLSHTI